MGLINEAGPGQVYRARRSFIADAGPLRAGDIVRPEVVDGWRNRKAILSLDWLQVVDDPSPPSREPDAPEPSSEPAVPPRPVSPDAETPEEARTEPEPGPAKPVTARRKRGRPRTKSRSQSDE